MLKELHQVQGVLLDAVDPKALRGMVQADCDADSE
jgi:hypothetical protein